MLIQVLVMLVIAGAAVYLVNALISMDARFKTALNVIVSVLLFIWVLNAFGLLPGGVWPAGLRCR